jgi:hypothetical protein
MSFQSAVQWRRLMEGPRMSWQLYVVAAMMVVYSALLHWVAV